MASPTQRADSLKSRNSLRVVHREQELKLSQALGILGMSPGVATHLGCRLRDILRHCCCQLRPNATASPRISEQPLASYSATVPAFAPNRHRRVVRLLV